ncbi:hypothetical protein F4780DRAFT_124060 [Xylariomycetidae sp. FL0641]|nr:hypothetical protein F4780DRAFT_124060 [Xylariomycetidae sp. FL0641]
MALPGAVVVPAPTTAFDNASVWQWQNLTSWTVQQLKHSVNVTNLILAGPRMLTRLGNIIAFPDAVDGFGQRVIPDPTGSDYFVTTTTSEMAAAAGFADAAGATAASVLEGETDPGAAASRFSIGGGAKGLGSVFSYATSKWALCCCAMAIILNRTHIFAASRRRLRLGWASRLLLRGLPILLFAYQSRQLLQAIQCQTSPDFSELRWGNASKSSDLMFAEPGGYLHSLSSTLLFGASDEDSCRAISMVPSPENPDELRGSLSQLWPLFGTVCLSQFIETISCAVQGRVVAVETGMTLFEHSLAFAEADAAISSQLGWGYWSSDKPEMKYQQASGSSIAVSRSMILGRVNTPPEVLLVAFISAMSHITSHTLGIFGAQHKFRLFSTGLWAMCFMGSLVAEAFNFSLDNPSSMGLFRFPTVCIIGFVPHAMVLAGILVCFVIYSIALVLAALEPPNTASDARDLSFWGRIKHAHDNMQANVSLGDIRITRSMDFYTALLRTGFAVITMASEAVYLNEDHNVNLKRATWLEEQRYRELESLRMQWAGSGLGASRQDSVGTIGLVPVKDGQAGASSGYARERAAQKVPKQRMGERRTRDGVGAAERSSRWLLALEFLMNINRLLLRWGAVIVLKGLARIGIQRQPGWLVYLSHGSKQEEREEKKPSKGPRTRAYLGWNGRYTMLINDETADFEAEVRRVLDRSPETANMSEAELDARLYDSWKRGQLWGSVDTSGDWEPAEDMDDWDTTSMMDSVIGDDEDDTRSVRSDYDPWEDLDNEQEADGQRTPTQDSFSHSRESTPTTTLDMANLARLLHPTTPDDRREAHALAVHLRSDRIVTRAGFARQERLDRGKLLLSAHGRRQAARRALTNEEESELLESLILKRRAETRPEDMDSYDPDGGDEDEVAGGASPCVVCHASARKIILWPCRCLCLCDECRVTLAMNNFDKCVCCRREVGSFSRIYVP